MEPIDSLKNRLKKATEIRQMKPVTLHELTGISESLISKYISGNAIPRQKKITLLAEALNVNPVWLMGYDVEINTTTKLDNLGNPVSFVPILGTVKAGYDYLAQENIVGTIDIATELARTGDFFALKVKGDSMSPVIIEGDYVIVKKQNDFESGDIVVALINGDEATIKKAKKSDAGLYLQPLNTNYEPLIFSTDEINSIPVKIIGVVKELKRRFY